MLLPHFLTQLNPQLYLPGEGRQQLHTIQGASGRNSPKCVHKTDRQKGGKPSFNTPTLSAPNQDGKSPHSVSEVTQAEATHPVLGVGKNELPRGSFLLDSGACPPSPTDTPKVAHIEALHPMLGVLKVRFRGSEAATQWGEWRGQSDLQEKVGGFGGDYAAPPKKICSGFTSRTGGPVWMGNPQGPQ